MRVFTLLYYGKIVKSYDTYLKAFLAINSNEGYEIYVEEFGNEIDRGAVKTLLYQSGRGELFDVRMYY